MRLTLDFETASNVDLRKVGAWAYAEHPTTEVLCAAWIFHELGSSYVWVPGVNDELLGGLRQEAAHTTIFEAHNASFEQAIWHYIMVPRYGMPPIPIGRWDCTMACCLYRALPASLDAAAKVLGLSEQKDMEGSKLTLSLSKPMTIVAWMKRVFK